MRSWGDPMDERVKILRQEALTPLICKMVLQADEAAACAEPGQFVNLYCDDKSRLLPRPISICDADRKAGTLTLIYAVVGKGTEEFAAKKAGDTIRLLGPLGHGFPVERAKEAEEIRIVGGGLGMPPLVMLAKRLRENGIDSAKVRIFLGFRDEAWMGSEFEGLGRIYPSSDHDRSLFIGTVVDRMQAADAEEGKTAGKIVLYTCGPMPMMRAIQQTFENEANTELWFSLEERMGCGIGACAGCPAKIRQEDGSIARLGICKKGPVFDGKAVVF